MFKSILNTFATRVISAAFSFCLLILTTRYLGVSGRGLASLVTASVGTLVLFNGFVGGTSLVYLIPKNKDRAFLGQALALSYCWVIVVCFFGTFIFWLTGSVPKDLLLHILFLGILFSVFTTNTTVLLSQEKIFVYNASYLVQVILNFSLFGLMIVVLKSASLNIFLLSLYVSYLVGVSFAIFFLPGVWKSLRRKKSSASLLSSARQIVKYGFISQLGNVVQYLNYRLSYFILNYFSGAASVGVYSVGVMLSEAVWIVALSISLVQYSKIANIGDNVYSKNLTVKLSKFSFLFTFICVLILLIIPKTIITFIFGKGFSHVHNVIVYLSVGILSFGFSAILSHYFAGTGRYYVNTIAALLGLAITVAGNFLLVPRIGYIGAGITASSSYLVTSIFLTLAFIKIADVRLASFKPLRDDLNDVLRVFERIKG